MTAKYGWEILADAIRDAHFDLVVGVPGRPVTPVQDSLVASGHARWANHEAAGAQYVLGASACGARTALLVKQVGMNVAADLLACAAPHRTGGAMVVIVGDDPDATSSQVEGDSRRLATAVEAPCFEPAGVADSPAALVQAIALSITLQVPTILRVTTPMLMQARAEAPSKAEFPLPSAAPFDVGLWSTDFASHRRLLLEELHSLPETDAFERRQGDPVVRIVASGSLAAQVQTSTEDDLLAVRRVFPTPGKALADFAAEADSPILVLEEGGPLLEDEVRARAAGQRVLGRYTGHVPWAGSVDAMASRAAAVGGAPLSLPEPSPYVLDPSVDLEPFGDLWTFAGEEGLTPIAADAGHCGEAISLDGGAAPLSYGLGSAIGVAAGIALAKRTPAIAVTGDMGAFHGLPGLTQAVRDQLPVIVFIEDDGAATTTGGQLTPSAPAGPGERVVSLAAVARAIGVEHVETISREEMVGTALRGRLRFLAKLSVPSVVIIDEQGRS